MVFLGTYGTYGVTAMSDYYILEGKTPIKVGDALAWARAFEQSNRRVARDEVGKGKIVVSTVFLGLDHRFGNEGPPQIFETMIFGGSHDQYQTRCSTWDEAERQHATALEMARLDVNYLDADRI